MKSEEARVAEAITSLTTRLEACGIDEARAMATEYVNDMIRNGWRPRAHEVWQPPAAQHGVKTDPKPWAEKVRAELRAAKEST